MQTFELHNFINRIHAQDVMLRKIRYNVHNFIYSNHFDHQCKTFCEFNNTEQNSTCSKWNWKPQMRKRGLNWCPLSNRVKEIRLTSHFSWINLVLQYGFVHSGTQCSHRNHLLAEALLQITGGSYFPHLMGHHFAHSASCREGEKGVTFTFHLLTTSLTNILHFTHTSDCETYLRSAEINSKNPVNYSIPKSHVMYTHTRIAFTIVYNA